MIQEVIGSGKVPRETINFDPWPSRCSVSVGSILDVGG